MPIKKTSVIIISSVALYASAYAEGPLLFAPSGANFYVYHKGSTTFYLNRARATALEIGKSLAKLSTGKRINKAGDDPAGLAVADKIQSIVNEINFKAPVRGLFAGDETVTPNGASDIMPYVVRKRALGCAYFPMY